MDAYAILSFNGNNTYVVKAYPITNNVGKGFSIANFLNDLQSYMNSEDGLFGITAGGFKIIIYLGMLVLLGIMVTRFGLDNGQIILFGFAMLSWIVMVIFGTEIMPVSVPILLTLGALAYSIWEYNR